MELPDKKTVLTDRAMGVTFEVYAYRQLSVEEARLQVLIHLRSRKKKPRKGQRVKVYTIIGAV